MSHHDLLHNLKPTKKCPVDWDSMTGSEVVRTCTKCGRLVLNEQEVESEKFDEVMRVYKPRMQQFLFRRLDGKFMIRACGMEANFELAPVLLGWTGGIGLLFSIGWLWVTNGNLMLPIVLLMLYAWNVLGCFVLSRHMLDGWKVRFIIFIFLTPIAIAEILTFSAAGLYLYWVVMFGYTIGDAPPPRP